MSEEENKTGTEEVKEVSVETKEEKVEVKEEDNKEGKKFVEFTPEQEARFKRVYGHMKEYERNLMKLAQQNGELIGRLEEMESKYLAKDTGDRLSALKAEKKAAYESGNIDRVMEIDDQIMELKSFKVEKKEKPPALKEAEEWLTPERKVTLDAWASEQDKDGNQLRPWASPAHPKHKRLVEMAAGVLNDPDFANEPLERVLEEVDKLMGIEKPKVSRTAATVLNGDGNVSQKKSEGKLSPEQERVARMMFPNEKDPMKKYRESIKKWGVTA